MQKKEDGEARSTQLIFPAPRSGTKKDAKTHTRSAKTAMTQLTCHRRHLKDRQTVERPIRRRPLKALQRTAATVQLDRKTAKTGLPQLNARPQLMQLNVNLGPQLTCGFNGTRSQRSTQDRMLT
jgi:hypothetical protein